MALLLTRHDIDGILGPEEAIEAIAVAAREEAEGTAANMAPFGGASGVRRTMRVVGGALFGLGRAGLRAGLGGSVALLVDVNPERLLAVMGYPLSTLRVGATMALGARYLARPDARRVGVLGSGTNSPAILRCLKIVRPIERVDVYSPTPEHRARFAERETRSLGIPVTAHDSADPVIAETDILVVATNSNTPVLAFDQLRPGVHVTSMGLTTELDASVYLGADQFVASSREQEVQSALPNPFYPDRPVGGPLHDLLRSGELSRESIVELGSLVRGEVQPRNGASDINLFRESRGGTSDLALINCAYELARKRGLGTEFDFG